MKNRETDKQSDRQTTDRKTTQHTEKQQDPSADCRDWHRKTRWDRQTNRQTDRQTDWQSDEQINTNKLAVRQKVGNKAKARKRETQPRENEKKCSDGWRRKFCAILRLPLLMNKKRSKKESNVCFFVCLFVCMFFHLSLKAHFWLVGTLSSSVFYIKC